MNNSNSSDLFDFERLVVYQKAMVFRRLINPITLNPPRKGSVLADHLDRSTDSVLLNIPEGNGYPFRSKNRVKHFRIALGSAKEAASAWNVLEAKGFLDGETYSQGRERMLSAMTPP